MIFVYSFLYKKKHRKRENVLQLKLRSGTECFLFFLLFTTEFITTDLFQLEDSSSGAWPGLAQKSMVTIKLKKKDFSRTSRVDI
jgi:hypothetical protein